MFPLISLDEMTVKPTKKMWGKRIDSLSHWASNCCFQHFHKNCCKYLQSTNNTNESSPRGGKGPSVDRFVWVGGFVSRACTLCGERGREGYLEGVWCQGIGRLYNCIFSRKAMCQGSIWPCRLLLYFIYSKLYAKQKLYVSCSYRGDSMTLVKCERHMFPIILYPRQCSGIH